MVKIMGGVGLAVLVLLVSSANAYISSPTASRLFQQGLATSQIGPRKPCAYASEGKSARLAAGPLALKACDAEGEGFRSATAADTDLISKMVKAENMNPLFLDHNNFLVAQDDERQVVGIGQIRGIGKQFEMASLAVLKDMQGNGIGTALVNELLERHKAKCLAEASDPATASIPDVFLLTLVKSAPFYTRMSFLEIPVSMAPMGMQMEAAAGTFLAKMSGGELTCMRYKFPSTELKCSGSGTVLKQANEI